MLFMKPVKILYTFHSGFEFHLRLKNLIYLFDYVGFILVIYLKM